MHQTSATPRLPGSPPSRRRKRAVSQRDIACSAIHSPPSGKSIQLLAAVWLPECSRLNEGDSAHLTLACAPRTVEALGFAAITNSNLVARLRSAAACTDQAGVWEIADAVAAQSRTNGTARVAASLFNGGSWRMWHMQAVRRVRRMWTTRLVGNTLALRGRPVKSDDAQHGVDARRWRTFAIRNAPALRR